MRKTIAIIAVATEALGAAVYLWRRTPRIGSGFVNSVVNPWLRRGLAGGTPSEIGQLEHMGRKSGIRRLTPVSLRTMSVQPSRPKDGSESTG